VRTSRLALAILPMAAVIFATEAIGQAQAPPPASPRRPPPEAQSPVPGEEERVEGQVGNIDPSGTQITLTDGTRLTAPPGAALRPGALAEGDTVIASYKEINGDKVLTGLSLKAPSASPPSRSTPPGSPPPGASPKP
jgi:hypothetical protein